MRRFLPGETGRNKILHNLSLCRVGNRIYIHSTNPIISNPGVEFPNPIMFNPSVVFLNPIISNPGFEFPNPIISNPGFEFSCPSV